jgi:DNA-binding CsgD family transcriptional regulator
MLAVGGEGTTLLELIGDTQGLLELDEFRHELLSALQRAVPSDWVSVNDIGPEPDSTVVLAEPPPPAELIPVFARYAHENPLVDFYARTRNGRAMRFSDLITREELHALDLYTQVYVKLGVEYQIAFTLPHEPERILGVALSRQDRDFSDEERDLLDQARPFLIQAYRNAIRYTTVLSQSNHGQAAATVPRLDRLVALGLTRRQAEILLQIATGASERDIAQRLSISQRTVEKHLERCYRRLGVNSRSVAASVAWATLDQERPTLLR